MKRSYSILVIAIFFSSCILHQQYKIAGIKNLSNINLKILLSPKDNITDSNLVQPFNSYIIEKNQFSDLTLPNINPKYEEDSSIVYISIFDKDMIDLKEKKNDIVNLKEKAFVKKYVFQLNKIRYPLDTIYIIN